MNKHEFLKRELQANVSQSVEIRKTLAETIAQGNAEALSAIGWMQGKVQAIVLGQYSEFLLSVLAGTHELAVGFPDSDEGKINSLRALINEEILRWRPERTSSEFSNATGNEKFLALTQLAQRLQAI